MPINMPSSGLPPACDWLSPLIPNVSNAYFVLFTASSLIYIAIRMRAHRRSSATRLNFCACTAQSLSSISLSAAAAAPPPPPPLTFTYHDSFLGKAVCIPVVHHLQIAAPLMLLTPALHFARGRAAAGSAPRHPPPPVGCMLVELWPAQRTRFMFGFTLKACDRASTAPASSRVYSRTPSRWSSGILQRVMAGYGNKVQVRRLLRMRARRLFY
jgi:hypothetical protein